MINEDKIRQVYASDPKKGFKMLMDNFHSHALEQAEEKRAALIRQGEEELAAAREKAHGMVPVSYTHLDVYKRQALRRRVIIVSKPPLRGRGHVQTCPDALARMRLCAC